MKNTQAPLLLAVILAAPAFAFADSIPGHSKTGNNYVTFSEGLTDQQDLQGNTARCNFPSGVTKENGLQASSTADASFSGKGEKDSEQGISLIAGLDLDEHSGKLVDFGANQGASPDEDKGKGWAKDNGEDSDGNGTGAGSGDPSPAISVAEPGSQTLLLVGLAALGMLFHRRKTLTNAI